MTSAFFHWNSVSLCTASFCTPRKGKLACFSSYLLNSYFCIPITCDESVQFSSVTQSCPTLCDPMNHSTPGLPVHHQLPEFTQTHVHRVSDAIQPSHPLSSPSPPAPNPSQCKSLFRQSQFIEVFTGLTLLPYLERCNVCLGTDADS